MEHQEPRQPSSLEEILRSGVEGHSLTIAQQQALAPMLLADPLAAKAFGVTSETVYASIQARSRQLRAVYPNFANLCGELGWPHPPLRLLWEFWLPLAMQLAEWRQQLGRPLIQGILGGQGTGKTTLAKILTLLLGHLGYQACSLSLDDLYKTYAARQELQQHDPRLRWRGPPGTHDLELGLAVLQQLRQPQPPQPIWLPRFDKSAWNGAGDRTEPEPISAADIVLFEGWFVGARPIDPAAFSDAPPPIRTAADRDFARDMNAKLQDYLPLWQQLDRLMILYPTDYRLSQRWRQQAEQQMMASGQSGMTHREIEQFVEYFWRSLHPELFIRPLLSDPTHVDLVVEINSDHCPHQIYRPADLS